VSTEGNDAPAPEPEPAPEIEPAPVPVPAPVPPPPPRSRLVRAAAAIGRVPGALERAYLWMRSRYGAMDARTAGFYRIVIGFLCAADCIRHW
jgi:hypothetical protein